MAEETFIALKQFHLGPDRIVKVGEEFTMDARELREIGSLCGVNPQAVRKGDPRIADAVKAEKARAKRAAQRTMTAAEMRTRIEQLERQLGSAPAAEAK